jgi:uncharacterized protein (DUF849 family)
MLQVCLNGSRSRAEFAHLPVTPDELAVAAVDAVRAGAEDIHLHPKNAAGEDTVEPACVAAAVTAVRTAVPGVPVGVTTGAWTTRNAEQRVDHIRSWSVLPDHASVNWHEDGAAMVAGVLLAHGVGIEAGIFSGTDAACRFLAWPEAHQVLRVLAEITDTDPRTAPRAATSLLDELETAARPILLHGEDAAAWTILDLAVSRRLTARIGLEDVLHLPDGTLATSNADLVRCARQAINRACEERR